MRELLESFRSVLQQGAQADKTSRSMASSSMFDMPNHSEPVDDIISQFDQLV